MAFAGLGDAILYPVLPVYAEKWGVPIIWVGFLLSINRFVRIISNTWMANAIVKVGMKNTLLLTSCLAVITTVVYGLKLGLLSFLIARIIWGFSYSGLKIATLNYAIMVKNNVGFVFGLTQSIKSLGALLVLLFGPVLILNLGIEKGLMIIAVISSGAIFLSLTLPNINHIPANRITAKLTFSLVPINILIASIAIGIDGILVVVLAILFGHTSTSTTDLLTIVAYYLLLKRFAMVCVSLISGIISIKISPIILFNISVISCIIGLLLIAVNCTIQGVFIAFIANAIVVTFSPIVAIANQIEEGNSLQVIASVSTWWDIGAGLGAFVGLALIQYSGQQNLFITLAILISALFTNFIIQNGKTNRRTI